MRVVYGSTFSGHEVVLRRPLWLSQRLDRFRWLRRFTRRTIPTRNLKAWGEEVAPGVYELMCLEVKPEEDTLEMFITPEVHEQEGTP